MFGREKILFETDTDYEHYQVIEMIYEGRKARVLFSGNREAAFSGIPLDDHTDLLFDYIQRFFELVATVRPKRLLLIGGGTYTLPTALLHALPDIAIDVVEIDDKLDTIAEAFFNYQPNQRMRIFHQDGYAYLNTCSDQYDMVIIDAFTQLQIPETLSSIDTVKLVNKILAQDGIVAMNIISAYYGRRAERIRYFYDMYRLHFNKTIVYPADTDVSLWQSQNFILTAQKGATDISYGLRFGDLDPPIPR